MELTYAPVKHAVITAVSPWTTVWPAYIYCFSCRHACCICRARVTPGTRPSKVSAPAGPLQNPDLPSTMHLMPCVTMQEVMQEQIMHPAFRRP